jgi:hypothetical protein
MTTAAGDSVDMFWNFIDKHGFLIQNHGNHNFSCWKHKSQICRFKLPSISWNQLSGFIQLQLTKPADNIPSEVTYRKHIAPIQNNRNSNNSVYIVDKRNIILIQQKMTSDNQTIRTFAGSSSEYDQNISFNDGLSNNGKISPFNHLISYVTLAHNNLQWISRTGMGSDFYIAKYITKGLGRAVETVSLMYESMHAINQGASSVATDNATNPTRNALYALTKAINNGTKKQEFSIFLMLHSLLKFGQYQNTHENVYVNVYPLIMETKNRWGNTEAVSDIISIGNEAIAAIGNEQIAGESIEPSDAVEDNINSFDIDEMTHGDITSAQIVTNIIDNNIIMCPKHFDYLYRGEKLKELCFYEYNILISKEIIPPISVLSSTIPVVNNDVEDNDNDVEDNEDVDGSVNDIVDDDNIRILPNSRGRMKNPRYKFHINHPQYLTHQQVAVSFKKVPILCGQNVPIHPKHVEPEIGTPDHSNWLKMRLQFATYYICLLTPFNVDTFLPHYSFSYEDLLKWYFRTDINNVEERHLAVIKSSHKFATQILDNCVDSTFNLSIHKVAESMLRNKVATSKEDYLLQQSNLSNIGTSPPGNDDETLEIEQTTNTNTNTNIIINPVVVQQNIDDVLQYMQSDIYHLNNENNNITLQTMKSLYQLNISSVLNNIQSDVIPASIENINFYKKSYNDLVTYQLPSIPTSQNQLLPPLGSRRRTIRNEQENLNNQLLIDHNAKVAQLKDSQLIFYSKLKRYADFPSRVDVPLELLMGSGGTGKTFTISLITQYFILKAKQSKHEFPEDVVCTIAPTAVAGILHCIIIFYNYV